MRAKNPWNRLQSYYQRTAAMRVFKKPFVINRRERPLISFTFDDFPRSALFSGGQILNDAGLAGTYYASLGLAGKQAPSGEIFYLEDLPRLFDQGHELGCHTYSHCDSWQSDPKIFEASVIKNGAVLNELFEGEQFRSFAYPVSLPRPRTKALVSDHFFSCRAGGQETNIGTIDLNQLAACFLEKYRENIQPVKDIIDQNRLDCGWLIFATHDVADSPTPYGCTPGFFERVVRYAIDSGAQILPVIDAMEVLGVPECRGIRSARSRAYANRRRKSLAPSQVIHSRPLVSILIPAHNAEKWIAGTIRSGLAQTWERKEIVIVDDGSNDQTLSVARQFESDNVRVIGQNNQGAAAARNNALAVSRGDYVQWLDADDILDPDKIARQMAVLDVERDKRLLVSSEFGKFLFQWQRAQFVRSRLWEDLSPVEWLIRKMGENLYMQTATWLVSRELSEVSGLWDTRMLSDDDGEYFCRVLLRSHGTRFVPDAKVYYRAYQFGSLAHIGVSNKKREALWLSMKLHIGYLRSLEDSPRTREACLTYLQRNLIVFYPERSDIVKEAEQVALELGGRLRPPHLSWKYSWIKTAFGWTLAKNTAIRMRKVRWSLEKSLDRALFLTTKTDS